VVHCGVRKTSCAFSAAGGGACYWSFRELLSLWSNLPVAEQEESSKQAKARPEDRRLKGGKRGAGGGQGGEGKLDVDTCSEEAKEFCLLLGDISAFCCGKDLPFTMWLNCLQRLEKQGPFQQKPLLSCSGQNPKFKSGLNPWQCMQSWAV
jgi:hypothetical protein